MLAEGLRCKKTDPQSGHFGERWEHLQLSNDQLRCLAAINNQVSDGATDGLIPVLTVQSVLSLILYFKNLSNVASSVQQASAPKLDQLKQFYVRAEGAQQLTPEQVYAVANQLGIAKSIVGKVLAVGRMTDSPGIDVDKFLFLLLVMTCDNFRAVLSQLFSLFGQNIESSRFHLFISYLAPDMDPDITSQFLIDLEQQLGERGAITYEEAVQLPVIQSKL
ncbi:hypothetical protein DUNSADRAFT_15197 [Dunaliella salina]|uniref:Encoded protein n=1 Tax=Dunaliella salina TaxID=3046 RepID=A0ABQ7G5Y9_DUNSA|nr:hypothetical protein DUNSADRAFT_15197 [Dunaliella salina]|eukprot:KAF5829989.1 hypothetical protein DUNSADRAFT_15197 [Dunaliella salina]